MKYTYFGGCIWPVYQTISQSEEPRPLSWRELAWIRTETIDSNEG